MADKGVARNGVPNKSVSSKGVANKRDASFGVLVRGWSIRSSMVGGGQEERRQ